MSHRSTVLSLALLLAVSGCNVNAALEQVLEARRLSADVLVQFTKAANASNLAVMADTDAASIEYAEEARQRTAAARTDVSALRPLLEQLKFSEELRTLDDFQQRFEEYQKLDHNVLAQILELSRRNTNVRSLALSLTQKPALVSACEERLQALQSALAKHGYTSKRWP